MALTLQHRSAVASTGQLSLDREDITFANITPELVRFEVTVCNDGPERSEPTFALLQAAPLGAFVPWQPLGIIRVAALEPGESFVLRTEGLSTRPAPLGPPDRVGPRQLLTALGAEDDRPKADTGTTRGLPRDLFQLLGQGNVHWAGNLNVFIGGKAVERHMAMALRVYPGRTNLAMFVVGSGADAYRFCLDGDAAKWDATLYDGTEQHKAIELHRDNVVAENRWIDVTSQRLMLLTLCPPLNAAEGKVDVHVAQRSTGQEAVVEFNLDPKAAGPGCYVVG